MNPTKIENVRLDATGNDQLMALARAGAAAFGYTAELGLDRQLAQLLRLRVAQVNNCTYCLSVHHAAARDAGIEQVKIETLTAWWETQLFTGAERAALAYAEALTRVADTTAMARFQDVHDKLSEHFGEEQILEIRGCGDQHEHLDALEGRRGRRTDTGWFMNVRVDGTDLAGKPSRVSPGPRSRSAKSDGAETVAAIPAVLTCSPAATWCGPFETRDF